MARVFVSHTSTDLDLAVQVGDWLRAEGHQVFLDRDLAGGLVVGQEWKVRLYRELRNADAMVCLVTKAFVASAWRAAEVGIAEALGTLLLPVRAEDGASYPLLESLQYADLARDPAGTRAQLVSALRALDTPGVRHGWSDVANPFPGLEPFDTDRAAVFFGRGTESRRLAGQLRAGASRSDPNLLVVVGPSGCGKSSLLRAGLLPLLAGLPEWLVVPPWTPGADPVQALARSLTTAGVRQGHGWSSKQVRNTLESDRGLDRLASELLANNSASKARLLVSIDQAEELFTRASASSRDLIGRLLSQALDGPVSAVATLRSEYLDDWLATPALASVPIETFPIHPLDTKLLRVAVEEPARIAGLRIEEKLVDRLVADTGQGDALPLLAFTLQQLAEGRQRGETLASDRYDQLGGVEGALVRLAEQALAEAANKTGLDERGILNQLMPLVGLDAGGRLSRRPVSAADLTGPASAALGAFVDRRLLVIESDGNGQSIKIGHEALLSSWPPLAEAISQQADRLRVIRSVERAAEEWTESGRKRYGLWDADRLAYVASLTGDLPDSTAVASADFRHEASVREFLAASRARARRRRVVTSGGLAVLLVLSLFTVGSLAALQARTSKAQRAAVEAQLQAAARALVAQADAARDKDPLTALRLGAAAYAVAPGPDTRASLVNTLTATPYASSLGEITSSVLKVAFFAPDGRTIATGGTDGTVTLWDVSDRGSPRRLSALADQNGNINALAFSPDGATFATGGSDGGAVLWDVRNPGNPRRFSVLRGDGEPTGALAFSPDGRTLSVVGQDGSVVLWDVGSFSTPAQLARLDSPASISSVAFSLDGRTLAAATSAGVALWDVNDPANPALIGESLTGTTGSINAVAFDPSGDRLAAGSANGTLLLWDVDDPASPLLETSLQHQQAVLSVAFSGDGRLVATGGADGIAIVWNIADLANPIRAATIASPGALPSVDISPDGVTLATGGTDGTTKLWDLTFPEQPRRISELLTGQGDPVYSAIFSADGRTLAAGGAGGTVALWDVSDPNLPLSDGPSSLGEEAFVSAAFSRDGRTFVTGGIDGAAVLWDLTDPARPTELARLRGAADPISAVVVSPDGRTVVTGDSAGDIALWDITDSRRPIRRTSLAGSAGVSSLSISGDSRLVAAGRVDSSTTLVGLTEEDQSRVLSSLGGHTAEIMSVAFSPDSRVLATGSADGTALLWEVTQPNQPRRVAPPLSNLGSLSAIAFANDLLVTGGTVGATVWDLADIEQPRRVGQSLANQSPVSAVALSPDETLLAVGTGNGDITLWDLAGLLNLRRDPLTAACSRSGIELSRAEWDQYLPDFPYRDICAT